MKAGLWGLLCAGSLLLPSAALAQDDFSGQWGVPGSTNLADIGVSPFGAAAVITQTADAISWQLADGRELMMRLNEPSEVLGFTYIARWVHRALMLEAKWPLPDGRSLTTVQMLFRNGNDELELVSVTPVPETRVGRLVYRRRK
jgi:hypothetical protein